jgi:FkbM family methyltransferase
MQKMRFATVLHTHIEKKIYFIFLSLFLLSLIPRNGEKTQDKKTSCKSTTSFARLCVPIHCGFPEELTSSPRENFVKISPHLTMALHNGQDLVSDAIASSKKPYCPDILLSTFEREAAAGMHLQVLDVGSNIGSCALLAASLGHVVAAIEPSQSNFELIQLSATLSTFRPGGDLTIFPVAAAASASKFRLFREKNNAGNSIVLGESGRPSLIQQFGSFGNAASYLPPEVVCTSTIDDLIMVFPTPFIPAICKIDTQGHELQVLQGMRGLLTTKSIKSIFMEVWPELLKVKGDDCIEIFSIATSTGYRIWTGELSNHEVLNLAQWAENCGSTSFFDILMTPIP